jgi:hypothetical protein
MGHMKYGLVNAVALKTFICRDINVKVNVMKEMNTTS